MKKISRKGTHREAGLQSLTSRLLQHLKQKLCITLEHNTHDWNNDKPYEWGLEILKGKLLLRTWRQEFLFCTYLY